MPAELSWTTSIATTTTLKRFRLWNGFGSTSLTEHANFAGIKPSLRIRGQHSRRPLVLDGRQRQLGGRRPRDGGALVSRSIDMGCVVLGGGHRLVADRPEL